MDNLFETYLNQSGEVGFAVRVIQSIVVVEGLPGAKIEEMVIFETGQLGKITGLNGNEIEVLVFDRKLVHAGIKVTRLQKQMTVPVGEGILGKTIDVLGRIVKGKQVNTEDWEQRAADSNPWELAKRHKIDQPLVTGVTLVDMLVPLGKGQRELIAGDRKTGKSSLLLQALLSQAKTGSVCVYAAVGKKRTDILKVEEFLTQMGILEKSVVVAAASQDSAGVIYQCPYTAMAVAEYFRDKGQDVIIVLDDMTTHAKFYRELSLLSRKFPGRDSYPGDIFHIHSKLMERAGSFWVNGKEVTITCLPVVETIQGDITGYIQTNMMSMTDGHIYFDSDLFFRGRRPAINPYISVTRVGRQTQTKLRRDAGRMVLDLLNSYERTQGFLRFGAELGENSRQILMIGDRILGFFDQPMYTVVPLNVQLYMLAQLLSGGSRGQKTQEAVDKYLKDPAYRSKVDQTVEKCEAMSKLIEESRKDL